MKLEVDNGLRVLIGRCGVFSLQDTIMNSDLCELKGVTIRWLFSSLCEQSGGFYLFLRDQVSTTHHSLGWPPFLVLV